MWGEARWNIPPPSDDDVGEAACKLILIMGDEKSSCIHALPAKKKDPQAWATIWIM